MVFVAVACCCRSGTPHFTSLHFTVLEQSPYSCYSLHCPSRMPAAEARALSSNLVARLNNVSSSHTPAPATNARAPSSDIRSAAAGSTPRPALVNPHLQSLLSSSKAPPASVASGPRKRKRLVIPGLSSDEDELTATPVQGAKRAMRPSDLVAQAGMSSSNHRRTQTPSVVQVEKIAPEVKLAETKPQIPAAHRYALMYCADLLQDTLCKGCCRRKKVVTQEAPRKTILQSVLSDDGRGALRRGDLVLARKSDIDAKRPGCRRYWHFRCLTGAHLKQLKRDWGRAGKRLPAPSYFGGFEDLRAKDKHYVFQSIRQCKLTETIT